MASLLLGIIYLAFISLGLPDALLGAAAGDVSGIRGARLLLRGHFHDYHRGHHCFQPAQRPG